MNDLRRYFESNPGNRINKWMHYFEVYDRFFSPYRSTDVHVLEIGVYHGGSLQMWRDYFGPKAHIFGVDINPYAKSFETEGTRIFIGDQEDKDFLDALKAEIPRVDILIDDGGHSMRQQIATFEVLFPHVSPTGVYVCEDLHTSYWQVYGGGYRRHSTFIEFSKHLVDQMHAWHSEDPSRLPVTEFTRSAWAIHYYNSMLVIEKQPIASPVSKMTGRSVLPEEPPPPSLSLRESIAATFRRYLRKAGL